MNIRHFKKSLLTALFCVSGGVASGQLLITQYYEGTSNNKFLEITNIGSESVDLSTYTLTRWTNAAAGDWKTATSSSAFQRLTGSLDAGRSYLIAHTSAALPIPASSANIAPGTFLSFNGDDSMALYNGLDPSNLPIISPANLVDVISFTPLGIDGENLSIVRKTTEVGFDLTPGSTFKDFLNVWEVVTLADANMAVLGQDRYLGSSALGSSSPVVTLSTSAVIVNEDAGTVDLTLKIVNPDLNSVSVDVVFDSGNSTASLADVSDYATQTVTFPAGSVDGDTQTVTVTLNDDLEAEPNESAIFLLQNLQTGGEAAIGGATNFTLTIVDNDTVIPQIYISEIADPFDGSTSRFVEIHNPTDAEVDLAAGGWNLVVYFNANTGGTNIPLTGVVPAGGIYVIALNSSAYIASYPSAPAPDQLSGNINFNGNDNLELRFGGGSLTGTLVDIYGIPGTDGIGKDYYYEDSQVTRNVAAPNAVFTIAEWTITQGANVADMTPGSLVPVEPPVISDPIITNISVNPSTGSGVMTVAGLGASVYILETSTDLGFSDNWEPVSGGYTEVDNGTEVDLLFSDNEAVNSVVKFYRLKKQ